MEPVQHGQVRLLVRRHHILILKIATCRHESMQLIREPHNGVLGLDMLLPRFDVFLLFALRRKHEKRDRDAGRVIGVHHGRVTRRGGLETRSLCADQIGDLAAPAVADDAPCFDRGMFYLELVDDLGDASDGLGWSGLGAEEGTEFFTLFLCVGRIPGDVGGGAFEEIGHEDLVLVVFVAMGEDVGALDGLRPEAEDVVDDQDALFSVGGAGAIWYS